MEERIFNFKKCHLQDGFEHIKIRDIRNIFNQSMNEDYYEPKKKPLILLITEIITSNMKAKGIKTKIDHPKNILIRSGHI